MIFLSVSKTEHLELTDMEYYGLVDRLYETRYPEDRCTIRIAERTFK